ncbi:MAG: DUF6438 domain-containing protein [Hyphomonadaceae bacterium]|nr:DUF6438 domain-containing protein [Hyphomonadaceae bacterium]
MRAAQDWRMLIFRTLGLSILTATLIACATPEPQPAPPASDASVKMFEGGCYSACTTYEIEVRPDGSYTLNGVTNTKTKGVTTGKLAPGAWAKAEAAFASTGFGAMPDEITGATRSAGTPPCIPDGPGTRITRSATAGSEKTVFWNQGCRHEPAELHVLIDQLRAAFDYDTLVKP